jgi:hypothetical protein
MICRVFSLWFVLSLLLSCAFSSDSHILAKSSDTFHLVIVRWNENLTWAEDYYPDVSTTVIQKVEEQQLNKRIHQKLNDESLTHLNLRVFQNIPKPNFFHDRTDVKFEFITNYNGMGRECSGYLYYILKNYQHLPTWIEFTHGAPERSASTARYFLMNPKGYFQSFAGNIVNRCFYKYRAEEQDINAGEIFEDDFEDVLRHIGINPPHCMRNFCCANFVVHKSRILAIPKESWEYLLRFSLLPRNGPMWRNNCYHLEHFWHMILGEPSHTYTKDHQPLANATYFHHDTHEEHTKWENSYRPYLKPH